MSHTGQTGKAHKFVAQGRATKIMHIRAYFVSHPEIAFWDGVLIFDSRHPAVHLMAVKPSHPALLPDDGRRPINQL
jgi:hypothetical protein